MKELYTVRAIIKFNLYGSYEKSEYSFFTEKEAQQKFDALGEELTRKIRNKEILDFQIEM